ncbi:MAG: ATP-binding protein [bacterium]
MYLPRVITQQVIDSVKKGGKVVIIYGPRQAGKTTLISHLEKDFTVPAEKFIGDDLSTQNIFSRHELEFLKKTIGNCQLLIIDEAQRIDNIGLSLKLLIDNLPLTVIVSGSASFDLANKIDEPLTGRTRTFWLYPLSYEEIKASYTRTSPDIAISEMLRFGMLPAVHNLTEEKDKINYLNEYINKHLYRDLLSFENVRKPKKVVDLLSLLALQVGSEVSVAELAQNLVLSQKTVESYLDVLEKMFIVYNLRGFSRNLRKEISKTSKYYFYDIGLRNALIKNFNALNLRSDVGVMFENFFIIEKIKEAANNNRGANFYFWRTYDQQEIDLIEESGGQLVGYECKWSTRKDKIKEPRDWSKNYDQAKFKIVNPENFIDYL